MRWLVRSLTLALVALIAAEGGYAVGATFGPPGPKPITHTITRTETLHVPGPVQWRTRKVSVVPQACASAIGAGATMAGLIDDYDNLVGAWRSLEVATNKSVGLAYDAGIYGQSSQSTVNALNTYRGRTTELEHTWADLRSSWKHTNWHSLAEDCRNSQ